MVDHSILLQKLSLFGLDAGAVKWMKTYLSGRSQSVLIDGCMSPLSIQCGVPQGSILGPLMYILFTNETLTLFIPIQFVIKHPKSFVKFVEVQYVM